MQHEPLYARSSSMGCFLQIEDRHISLVRNSNGQNQDNPDYMALSNACGKLETGTIAWACNRMSALTEFTGSPSPESQLLSFPFSVCLLLFSLCPSSLLVNLFIVFLSFSLFFFFFAIVLATVSLSHITSWNMLHQYIKNAYFFLRFEISLVFISKWVQPITLEPHMGSCQAT